MRLPETEFSLKTGQSVEALRLLTNQGMPYENGFGGRWYDPNDCFLWAKEKGKAILVHALETAFN